ATALSRSLQCGHVFDPEPVPHRDPDSRQCAGRHLSGRREPVRRGRDALDQQFRHRNPESGVRAVRRQQRARARRALRPRDRRPCRPDRLDRVGRVPARLRGRIANSEWRMEKTCETYHSLFATHYSPEKEIPFPMTPKLMSFDVFGTLVDVRAESYGAFDSILRDAGGSGIDTKAFWEHWETLNIAHYWEQYRRYRDICEM